MSTGGFKQPDVSPCNHSDLEEGALDVVLHLPPEDDLDDGLADVVLAPHVQLLQLEGVQQSHFGSHFVFRHFKLQIEMQIGAQMRTVVPHLKPGLPTIDYTTSKT